MAPDAQKMLARFDLGIPKSVIANPQLFYVRSLDLASKKEGRYQRHYTNIDRGLFDKYLIDLLPENVQLKSACQYIRHKQEDKNIIVSVLENGIEKEYECEVLVGADGANSLVRKNLYDDFSAIRKYLAIQGEYQKETPINHYAVFFDKTISDFYSWLIPKESTVIIGGAFNVDSDAKRKFKRLIEQVSAQGYTFGKQIKLDACFVIRPRYKDIKTGIGSVALIGEAAGFISPSSSEGISYAFRSASALANAFRNACAFDIRRYKRKAWKLRVNILVKNIKGLFMYTSFIRNMIFKMKIGAMKDS